MSSPSTRRLLKESTDLHKNPSPYFTAAPTSDTNLHDWHFTLAGPPSPSPYARGLYHGRITFPPTYPLRPPSFRFLTPSGRFEVNREICLSISGHHEETWQPAWGVRTALLGIRSEIFGAESQGQVGGMEGSEEVRREYARLSVGWRCRECGVENLEGMRGVWRNCREKGVEIDVESYEDGELETPTSGGSGLEGSEGRAMEEGDVDMSAAGDVPGDEVRDAPAQVSAPLQAQVQTHPSASTVRAPAADMSATSSTQLASTESLGEGVWLDRAIIGVIVALVVLILRRVANVNEALL
jgi:ubiquitin-conjugating enzyme E2 J1